MVDVAKIKEVRERTGVGFGDCKKALQEADWDIEAALDVLRKQSAVKAAKRADRDASEGRVALKIDESGANGAIVEVNSETDFSARNERFVAFCDSVVEHVLANGPDVIETMEDDRNALISAIGENISIRRADRIVSDGGIVAGYLHMNGVMGCIVELSADAGELNGNIAKHIVADNPMVVDASDLPPDVIERERAIFQSQAKQSGKPEKIIDNIVAGQLAKFKAESCLNQQSYIWDRKQIVGKLLAEAGTECKGFFRYQVGEGLD